MGQGQPNLNKQRDVVSQRSVHDYPPTPEMALYLNFYFLSKWFCKISTGLKNIISHTGEGRIGRLELADANYYVKNG